jgi:hypothetical protein
MIEVIGSDVFLNLPTITTPPVAPPAGFLDLYFKSDGNLYTLNSSSVESLLGSNLYLPLTGGTLTGALTVQAPITIATSTGRGIQLVFGDESNDHLSLSNPTSGSLYLAIFPPSLTGQYNTAIGFDALPALTSGASNTALGTFSGVALTTGNFNTLFGYNNGVALVSGSNNMIMGSNSGNALTSESDNIFLGFNAGLSSTGGQNVYIGSLAGAVNTSAANPGNVYIGYRAGSLDSTGQNNVGIGFESLSHANGSYNTGVGYQSGQICTGTENTFLGYNAGMSLTAGNNNIYLGFAAAYSQTGGSFNIGIGNIATFSSNSVSNELQIGSSFGPIHNAFIGSGTTSATLAALTINATGAQGTNTSAAASVLNIAGAKGTGTGAGGAVAIQIAPAGTSGSSANSLVTALTVDTNGNLLLALGYIQSPTLTTPSSAPPSGFLDLYFKSDGNLYSLNSSSVETQLTGAGGGGSVTSVSVVSTNGFAGTVATATTTPAITISTTVTGILYGNGTSVAAAIPSNFPVLNQNTTGTAANITATSNSTLTTLSALSLPTSQLSGSISLTSQVSGVLPIANGGTDNGSLAVTAGGVIYTDGTKFQNTGAGTSGYILQSNGSSAPTWIANTPTFSGLTQYGAIYASTSTTLASTAAGTAGYPLIANSSAAPTFQQLNISSASAAVTGVLSVANGGSGSSSFTLGYVLLGDGTSSFGTANPGSTAGYVLASNGSGNPSFQAVNVALATGTLAVTAGGTGNSTNPQFEVLVGAGNGSLYSVPTGTSGQVLVSLGSGNNPSMQTIPGNATVLKTPTVQSINWVPVAFTVTALTVQTVVGAVYTSGGFTYTVNATANIGATTLYANAVGNGNPLSSGSLGKSSGTGQTTIAYSAIANGGGSQTYTTPSSPAPLYIKVRIVGPGGGGGGSGTSGGAGGAGLGSTVFGASGAFQAGPGAGGGAASPSTIANGGAGGAVTVGTLTGSTNIFSSIGSYGSGGAVYDVTSTNGGQIGGLGGAAPFFAGANSNGDPVTFASGAGGCGGLGANLGAAGSAGGGGGSGAYIEFFIASPASSYSWGTTFGGNGGTAGSSGFAGEPGAMGQIIVEEYYQ